MAKSHTSGRTTSQGADQRQLVEQAIGADRTRNFALASSAFRDALKFEQTEPYEWEADQRVFDSGLAEILVYGVALRGRSRRLQQDEIAALSAFAEPGLSAALAHKVRKRRTKVDRAAKWRAQRFHIREAAMSESGGVIMSMTRSDNENYRRHQLLSRHEDIDSIYKIANILL
jgi:hypothetical protein